MLADAADLVSLLPVAITLAVIVVQIYLVVMLIRAANDIREIRNLLTDWYNASFGYPYDDGVRAPRGHERGT